MKRAEKKRAEKIRRAIVRVTGAVITPLLSVSLAACDDDHMNGDKVDYGPQATSDQVTNAVYGYLINGWNPFQTKAGSFVHFQTTENIAGGTLTLLVADTGQTTISRTEDDKEVSYNIIEKIVEYHQDSQTSDKLSRSFDLSFDKPATSAALSPLNAENAGAPAAVDDGSLAPASATDPDPAPAKPVTLTQPDEASLRATILAFAQRARTTNGPLFVQADPSPTPAPTATPPADPAPADPNAMTLHRLRMWTDQASPPGAVSSKPGCGGVSKCLLHLRHVVFDIVTHDDGESHLIHMELVASPDVPQTFGLNMNPIFPYIPGLVRSCVTRMVDIGTDGHSKTLLGDCNDVVNFEIP